MEAGCESVGSVLSLECQLGTAETHTAPTQFLRGIICFVPQTRLCSTVNSKRSNSLSQLWMSLLTRWMEEQENFEFHACRAVLLQKAQFISCFLRVCFNAATPGCKRGRSKSWVLCQARVKHRECEGRTECAQLSHHS